MEPTVTGVAPVPTAGEPRAAPQRARRTIVFPPKTHRFAEGLAFLAGAAVLLYGVPALNAAGRRNPRSALF